MTARPPILVVEAIQRGDVTSSADLLVGGQRERIELGFDIPGLIDFRRMPSRLGSTLTTRNAVINLVAAAHRGDQVAVPVDLSSVARAERCPWPVPNRSDARLEPPEGARSAVVEIVDVANDTPAPLISTVRLTIDGEPATVELDRGNEFHDVLFRFAAGPHPWQLNQADGHAMLVALGSLLPRVERAPSLTAPILHIESIHDSPDCVSAALCLGSDRIRIELEIPAGGGEPKWPGVLVNNLEVRRSIVEVLRDVHAGRSADLSLDLSNIVRRSVGHWPSRLWRDKRAASGGDMSRPTVKHVSPNTPEAGTTTVDLLVSDIPTKVLVSSDEEGELLFQFVEGPHPWQLTYAASEVMFEALAEAVPR